MDRRELVGPPADLILVVSAIVIILLTELTSNTATAAAFSRSLGTIAVGLEPFLMTIVVTFAVSCAFMLPVATPSNAVAFATGDLPTKYMIRTGIWLNLIGLLVIMVAFYTIVPLVFGVIVLVGCLATGSA